jgi:hypothetical protein
VLTPFSDVSRERSASQTERARGARVGRLSSSISLRQQPTSQEDVEVVRLSYGAFQVGDVETVFAPLGRASDLA